jgi:predicted  nucleic acid-binding Zn-ribbon protein
MKKSILDSSYLYVVWPEVALRLLEVQDFDTSWVSEEITDLLLRIIRRPERYNALKPAEKLEILCHFIHASYDLETLHQEVSKIGTRQQELQKEKTQLQDEIKSEENNLAELRAQLENQEALIEKREAGIEEFKSAGQNGSDSTLSKLRYETNKKQRELDEAKKDRQKIEYSVEKLEAQIVRKRAHYKKISREMLTMMHTSQFIGSDAEENNYWLYSSEPERVYVQSTRDEAWGFYESQREVDDLIKSIDTRGVLEQKLFEKIRWLMASELLSLKPGEEVPEVGETPKPVEVKKPENNSHIIEKMFFKMSLSALKLTKKEEIQIVGNKERNEKEVLTGRKEPGAMEEELKKMESESQCEGKMEIEESTREKKKKEEFERRIHEILGRKIERKASSLLEVHCPDEKIRSHFKAIKSMIYEGSLSCVFLGVEWFRQFILVLEALYSEYLFSRNMRWTRTREEFLKKLETAESLYDIQCILEEIGNGFSLTERLEELTPELKEAQGLRSKESHNEGDEESETLKPRKGRTNSEKPSMQIKFDKKDSSAWPVGDDLKFDDTKFYVKKISLRLFSDSSDKEFWSVYLQQEGDRLLPLLLSFSLFVEVVLDYLVRKLALKPSTPMESLLVEMKYVKREKPQICLSLRSSGGNKSTNEAHNASERVLRNKGEPRERFEFLNDIDNEEDQSGSLEEIDQELSEEEESEELRKQSKKLRTKRDNGNSRIEFEDFVPSRQTRSVSRKINNHIFS